MALDGKLSKGGGMVCYGFVMVYYSHIETKNHINEFEYNKIILKMLEDLWDHFKTYYFYKSQTSGIHVFRNLKNTET